MGRREGQSQYEELGVSSRKAGVHAAISGQDQGLFPGAFCKIIPDLAGNRKFCSVVHADGAGTKVLITWLMERLGLKAPHFVSWQGPATDSAIMNLDDLGCVGATGPFHLCNTIDRNRMQVDDGMIKDIVEGYQWLVDRLAKCGIDLQLTGGETADVPDLVRTLVVNSTVVTRLRRDQVIDASRIQVGDVIVGFSSTGQSAWEDHPNSGLGSNGLTLARHALLDVDYRYSSWVTSAPEIESSLVYAGSYHLEDLLPGDPRFTIGSALASPTRTYLPLIKCLLAKIPRPAIHGIIHCSGGGQTKIGKFGPTGIKYVIDKPFPLPPLFQVIKEAAGIDWKEMFEDFNMGWRLVVVVPESEVAAIIALAQACQIDAQAVGHVERWLPHPADTHKRQVEIFVPWANQTYSYYF